MDSTTPKLATILLSSIAPIESRASDEEIAALAESLDEGLQEPISVRDAGERYVLLEGEGAKRVRAARLLGWADIEALIYPAEEARKGRGKVNWTDETQHDLEAAFRRDPDFCQIDFARAHGVSRSLVQRYTDVLRGKLEVYEQLRVDPKTLSMSAQAKFDIALRRAREEMRAELEQEARDEVRAFWDQHLLPDYKRKEAQYVAAINAHKGLMPESLFRKILGRLHPDAGGDADAFDTFAKLKPLLVMKAERPEERPAGLPSSFEELMKRKAAVQARRRAAKTAGQVQRR